MRFLYDDIPSTGAQITFYVILSFFPFLIFLITLLSYTPVINIQESLAYLSQLLPQNAYKVVSDITGQAVLDRSGTLLSFGMVITLWSASNGVTAMIKGINKSYDQEETRPFWKIILVSLTFTLGLAMVIIFSLILIVFGRTLGNLLCYYLGFTDLFLDVWNNLRYVAALVTMLLVLVSLYFYIPNHRLRLIEVIPGSIFSTAGWIVTSLAFSYYANNFSNYSKIYGSIGGIIALLVWLYLSSIIILLGSEINASLSFARNGQVKPRPKVY